MPNRAHQAAAPSLSTGRRLPLFLLPLWMSLGCTPKDSAGLDDTGITTGDAGSTTATTTSHDGGCVTLSSDSTGTGFAWINDAIAAASSGDTVSLDSCEPGTHTETVVLDKALFLVGAEGLTLTSDGGIPLTVTADGASVAGLTLSSDDVAVSVTAGAVTLSQLTVQGADTWGIEAVNASELVIDDVVITGASDGGIHVQGGTASISGGSVTDSKGYGVLATDGAEISVSGMAFDSISQTSSGADDGVGLAEDAATLHTAGNTLTNIARYGILGTGGNLDLSGDSVTGALFGVLASEADLVASGLTVTDAWYCGIYGFSPSLAEITDSVIIGTPGEVLDIDPDDWGKAAYQSAGVFLIAPDSTISDTSVSGYSGVGVLVGAETSGKADLTRLTLTDQGHFGLYVSGVDTTTEDVTVSGTYATTSDPESLCTDVGSDVGVLVYDAELDWSGGSIQDIEGYGISNVYGSTQVDGVVVSRTTCGGVMAFGGDARITYSDFSQAAAGAFAGSIVSYQGASLYVGGSTFTDSANEVLDRSTESVVGGVLTRYDYYQWSGSDIQIWYGADATITQNSFANGVNAVELYGDSSLGYSSATLSDNSFSTYSGLTTYVGPGCSASITDSTITDHGPYSIACESGALELTRVTLSGGGSATSRTAVYEDDSFVTDLELASIGPSLFVSDCSLNADNLTVQDAAGSAVYLQNGSWEFNDLTIAGAGLADVGDGITASSTTGSSTLYINGGDISGVASGDGLSLEGSSTVATTIFDLGVTDIAGLGMSLVNTSGGTSTASLSRVSIDGSGDVGLRSEGQSLSLDTVAISSGRQDGLQLSGGSASLTSSSSQDNGGWGVVCENDVSLISCDVTATGNGAGAFSGCDATCSTDGSPAPR